MNPIEQLVNGLQEAAGQVPGILQPIIVMIAGAVPFIEGEGAAAIGVIAGINPIVAAVAAAAGNFLCVLLVVLLTSRARSAVVSRQTIRAKATVGAMTAADSRRDEDTASSEPTATVKPESKGRRRFNRWLLRFGVPGASILGPLAIPTQFTSAILVASGTARRWVLLWQAVAIALWTTVATISAWLALQVAGLA